MYYLQLIFCFTKSRVLWIWSLENLITKTFCNTVLYYVPIDRAAYCYSSVYLPIHLNWGLYLNWGVVLPKSLITRFLSFLLFWCRYYFYIHWIIRARAVEVSIPEIDWVLSILRHSLRVFDCKKNRTMAIF